MIGPPIEPPTSFRLFGCLLSCTFNTVVSSSGLSWSGGPVVADIALPE